MRIQAARLQLPVSTNGSFPDLGLREALMGRTTPFDEELPPLDSTGLRSGPARPVFFFVTGDGCPGLWYNRIRKMKRKGRNGMEKQLSKGRTGRRILLSVVVGFFLFVLPGLLSPAGAKGKLDTWEQVREAFRGAAEAGQSTLSFTLDGNLLREVSEDNSLMWYWGARGGAADFTWSWSSDGRVKVGELQGFDCPWREVKDALEYVAAVREMRSAQESRFTVLCGEELYALLSGSSQEAWELRLAAGLKTFDIVYTNEGKKSLEYRGCVYWQGGFARANSEAETLAAMERMGREGYDAFAVSTDRDTWDRLSSNGFERLNTLASLAFIEAEMSYYEEACLLIWEREGSPVFYPGYEIARAVSAGREDRLPERLQETLAAARAMLKGVEGTGAETALAIHDLLCRHVTYTVDESTDEDDRCVGAILNGKANCDGYADAYALLCALKGIQVRLWQGDDLNWEDPLDDTGHLWNLVLLDGVWRSTDVTWDDQDSGEISWMFYNIGTDRMRVYYTYLADLLPAGMLETTDLLDRPVPEFHTGSGDEVIAAVRTAGAMDKRRLILWMTEELFREYRSESQLIWKWMSLGGIMDGQVTYSDRDRRVEIRNAVWNDGSVYIGEADTEKELTAALKSAAGDGASQVRLYLGETLYDAFRRNGQIAWEWADRGGYRSDGISYSDEQRQLIWTAP